MQPTQATERQQDTPVLLPLMFLVLRVQLYQPLLDAGCRVLRERSGGRHHTLPLVAGPGARAAAFRMVQRADYMRQLR